MCAMLHYVYATLNCLQNCITYNIANFGNIALRVRKNNTLFMYMMIFNFMVFMTADLNKEAPTVYT